MGSVPITAGSGTPIRTLSNPGVDSGANQQVMTLADSGGDMISNNQIPSGMEDALMVRSMPGQVTKTGFSMAVANNVDSDFSTLIKTGAGQTVNQTGGNLVLTTGTTVNSETIIRSIASWTGAVRLRIRNTLSQRIVNQSFFLELVDVLGDALAITINSATSVTVTFASNPFTAANVGQYMYLGAYTGTGTFIPGRYAIASVSGNTVTYTVAGFAAGSGTVSVFGWNHHHLVYSGTAANNALWDTQRRGWNSGDTTIGINTTASPGHIVVMTQNDMQAGVLDALVASNSGIQYTVRGSRVENVPDDIPMRFQIRVVNGSTAPASSTTWTIGQVAISNWSPQDVTIQDVRPQTPMSALPVQVANIPTVAATLNASSNLAAAVAIGATTRSSFATASTASVWANVIKASAGSLHELTISNPTATAAFVKLYNKASAAVQASDIPIATYRLAASGTVGDTLTLLYGVNGKNFTLGITMAITGAVAATDTTATVAGLQVSGTYV